MKLNRIVSFMVAVVMTLSVLLTGCGTKQQESSADAYENLGTFDGEEIDYGVVYFAAMYQQANYEANYLESMGESMWSETITGNETFEENVKNSILTSFKEMLVLEKFAADYNVQLSTKESVEIREAAKQFMEDNTQKAIELMGATEDVVARYLELYTISNKVYLQIIAEADTEFEQEEYKQSTFSYVMLDKDSYEKAEASALLKKCSSDFDGSVGEGTDYELNTCSFGMSGTSDLNIEQSILNVAAELENGEVYEKLLETDSAYFIIRMEDTFDEAATTTMQQSMVSSAQSEHYTEVVEKYMEQVTFEIDEEAWNAITFSNHFSIITGEE